MLIFLLLKLLKTKSILAKKEKKNSFSFNSAKNNGTNVILEQLKINEHFNYLLLLFLNAKKETIFSINETVPSNFPIVKIHNKIIKKLIKNFTPSN